MFEHVFNLQYFMAMSVTKKASLDFDNCYNNLNCGIFFDYGDAENQMRIILISTTAYLKQQQHYLLKGGTLKMTKTLDLTNTNLKIPLLVSAKLNSTNESHI